jgi:hypothetical protein
MTVQPVEFNDHRQTVQNSVSATEKANFLL